MITTTSLSSDHYHRTILLLLLLAITPIIDGAAAAAGKNRAIGQNVILLLIDGFANSFLNDSRSSLYGLKAMADNGVQAEYLKPSFPTLSYPNWYSLVTGQLHF
jgi:predicted AlkP superfamily pyrophosphatase or phosphodiesterase